MQADRQLDRRMASRRATARALGRHAPSTRGRRAPRLCWRPHPRALLLVGLLAASCVRAGFEPANGSSPDAASLTDADASTDQMTTPYRVEILLASADPVVQGSCRRLDLTIRDQSGQLATLPAPVDTSLSADVAGASLFGDSACQNTQSVLSLDGPAAIYLSTDGPQLAQSIRVTATPQDAQVASGTLVVQTRARATAVALGNATTCAVAAGMLQCWGGNTTGELGDGTRTGRLTPTAVTIPGTAGSVATSGYHGCAATEQGALYCWGRNGSGQLGIGSRMPQLLPTEVRGLTNVTQVSLGSLFSCALSGGEVYCWGNDWAGQLGNGPAVDGLTPGLVQGLSGAIGLGIGHHHSCALLGDGAIACWGGNFSGELGTGDRAERQLPAAVVGLAGTATSIAAGEDHTCAVVDGGVQCWGDNTDGQLGTGDGNNSTSPVWVRELGSGSGVTALAAGHDFTCAAVPGGLRCWGDNRYGQLGDGSFETRDTPVVVEGVAQVDLLAAGEAHTCAVVAGVILCWGQSDAGQLGRGQPLASTRPRQVEGTGVVSDGAAGNGFTCTLQSGAIHCWGANPFGQLGDGTRTTRATASPDPVQGLDGCLDVACGEDHTCAIAESGVWCWGRNDRGQLGSGSSIPITSGVPVRVSGLPSTDNSQQVASFDLHTCALTNHSGLWCWGRNNNGQLGNNSTTESNRAVPVVGSDLASAVAAGWEGSCAAIDSELACWGRNVEGQCATGTATHSYATPQISPGPLAPVTAVTAGYRFACAVIDGAAMCWGGNERGELGDGSFDASSLPVAVQGLTSAVTQVAGGSSHACALVDGAVWCWGKNSSGQLGDGGRAVSPIPVRVGGLPGTASQIFVGHTHSCAVVAGQLWCWGSNALGELGEPWPGAVGAAPVAAWEAP